MYDELEKTLDELIELGVPGLSVCISLPDGRIDEFSRGVTGLRSKAILRNGRTFAVFSITKMFVAAIILQLIEEGYFTLDQKITSVIDLPLLRRIPHIKHVRVIHLLNHTSGILDYFEDCEFTKKVWGSDADLCKVWTAEDLVEIATKGCNDAYCLPGVEPHYSNTGFIILGLLIELVTGNSLGNEIQSRISDRLSLRNTYLLTGAMKPPDEVEPHSIIVDECSSNIGICSSFLHIENAKYVTKAKNYSYEWAAGGLVSTGRDLVRFLNAIISEDSVFSLESRAKMFNFSDPSTDWFGHKKRYGLGVFEIETDVGSVIGHTGSGLGYQGCLFHLPEWGITTAILCNIFKLSDFPLFVVDRLLKKLPRLSIAN